MSYYPFTDAYISKKKSDQMYTLLGILLTIFPKRIDEHVNNTLKQDHAEVVSAMAHREVEQLFSYACPKFVYAVQPAAEGDEHHYVRGSEY